jgi:hypothetical protein
MKYCFNCDLLTAGEPLFCNYCGRSYDVKLCPRMHPNPRSAEACSRCGSRDLSTPQPRRPLWAPFLQFILSLIPGVFLTLASVTVVLFFLTQVLLNSNVLLPLIMLGIALTILWSMWAQIPQWFRKAIYLMLERKRDGGTHGGNQ